MKIRAGWWLAVSGCLASPMASAVTYSGSGYSVDHGPVAVAAGDLNGDGTPDFVTANYDSATVSVVISNGDGTFTSEAPCPVGIGPDAVAIADVDGDGHPDLLVANETDNTKASFSVLLNKGNGTFGTATNYPTTPSVAGIVAADFDGDGAVDVAMAGPFWNQVVVSFNDGKGAFGTHDETYAMSGPARDVTAADFNGDGFIDLAVANQNNGTSGAITLLINNGDGTFSVPVTDLNTGGSFTHKVTHADVNGDGAEDLIGANLTSNQVTVFINDGKGGFGAATNYGISGPYGVAAADMDQDGHVDLLALNGYMDLFSVLPNNGDGTFGDAQTVPTGTGPRGIAITDVDGDGDPDVAVADSGDNYLQVVKNGTFVAPAPLTIAAVTNAARGASVDSEVFSIIGGAGPISVTGGAYSVNYGPFTTAKGIVHDGDKVQVRVTASSRYATEVDAVLTVAGVAATFRVTTVDAPASTASADGSGGGGGSGLDFLGALAFGAMMRRRSWGIA